MWSSKFFVRLGTLSAASLVIAGFTPPVGRMTDTAIPLLMIQTTPSTETASDSDAGGKPLIAAPETTMAPTVEPERPLTIEEQKAADERLKFDRVLIDAAVLLTDFENSKRGKSKTPPSMSAFRNLEIQLNAIADADPNNTQARDMAKSMQMVQFEILGPSLAAADVARRQLYVEAMAIKLKDQGIQVDMAGSRASVIRFRSKSMTREMWMKLSDSAKIIDQAQRLQFEEVVFSSGRRSWAYDLRRNRYR